MKIRETSKSLRLYFFVVGVFNLLNIGQIFQMQGNIISGIFGLIGVVLGLLYFYFGIKLNELLFKSSQLIINFIIVGMILGVISQLYTMAITGYTALLFIFIVVTVVIGLYLIANVKRLTRESQSIG